MLSCKLSSKHIDVGSTLKQCWLSAFNVVLVEIESWVNVHLSTLFQCWIKTTLKDSMNQRFFNVDIWFKMKVNPTYVHRRCLNVDKRILKYRLRNYPDSLSITQCCFNADNWLKMKVDSMYVYRCCLDVEKTTLKQFCQYFLYWCLLGSGSITKQN